jgi:peptide deformylase
MRLDGIAARVFQHELDHLNGILMTEHVSHIKLERAKKKQQKLMKKISRERKANRV